MSVAALEWATQVPGLSRLEKTILKELCNRYNEEVGCAWPSQKRLARDTGYSRASINVALNKLEAKNLIRRYGTFLRETGARTSNRYFLPLFAPHDMPE